MVQSTKTMTDNIQALSRNLSGWGIFIDDKLRLLLIAPPKCGSTSILKELYDKLISTSLEYESDFSHEYSKELCIHKHLRARQDCSTQNLKRIFADQNYKKILVVRDPIDRLCSAIISKYMINNSPHYQQEIASKFSITKPLTQTYRQPDEFVYDFNYIANILLTKGAIYGNQKSSHASSISEIVPKEILPFFNNIIDVTDTLGWTTLKKTLNTLFHNHDKVNQISTFPRVNENPISDGKRFLNTENYMTALGRYTEDYTNLKLLLPKAEEHIQETPSACELKSINTFLSLASRSINIFQSGKELLRKSEEESDKAKGNLLEEIKTLQEKHSLELREINNKSRQKISKIKEKYLLEINEKTSKKEHNEKLSHLKIKVEQLGYLEELSRKTAEQLLVESHSLKHLNHKMKTKINNLHKKINKDSRKINAIKSSQERNIEAAIDSNVSKYFPFYKDTKELDATTLELRAQKRVENKNFRSAKELLIQAYCMNKSSIRLLVKIYAVSTKNFLVRSLLLCLTKTSKRSISKTNKEQS